MDEFQHTHYRTQANKHAECQRGIQPINERLKEDKAGNGVQSCCVTSWPNCGRASWTREGVSAMQSSAMQGYGNVRMQI
eukprot:1165521-Amphidinium_carterae.1